MGMEARRFLEPSDCRYDRLRTPLGDGTGARLRVPTAHGSDVVSRLVGKVQIARHVAGGQCPERGCGSSCSVSQLSTQALTAEKDTVRPAAAEVSAWSIITSSTANRRRRSSAVSGRSEMPSCGVGIPSIGQRIRASLSGRQSGAAAWTETLAPQWRHAHPYGTPLRSRAAFFCVRFPS